MVYPLQYSWASLVAQMVKKSACNAGDLGSIPGLGRSPGKRKGYPLQYAGLENSMDCNPPSSSVRGDFPGKNTGVGYHALLQGIFPTQGLNPGLLHCGWILYQLSYKGSPRILEWVAYPSPGDLPNPGIEPGSPALLADSLPVELPGTHPQMISTSIQN